MRKRKSAKEAHGERAFEFPEVLFVSRCICVTQLLMQAVQELGARFTEILDGSFGLTDSLSNITEVTCQR